jgi:hypothetical protein
VSWRSKTRNTRHAQSGIQLSVHIWPHFSPATFCRPIAPPLSLTLHLTIGEYLLGLSSYPQLPAISPSPPCPTLERKNVLSSGTPFHAASSQYGNLELALEMGISACRDTVLDRCVCAYAYLRQCRPPNFLLGRALFGRITVRLPSVLLPRLRP